MDTLRASVKAAPAVKTQSRNVILLFCSIMQLSVGISYIWSVFQPHVMSTFGWDASAASMTYTISVLAFVVGGTISGKLQSRFSPKLIVIFAGILMGGGSILGAFTPASMPMFLYATYGIISGLGFGFIYNVAVALSQKWFYDKRGFAGGVVVSSLGFAGLLFTPIVSFTLSNYGLRATFVMLGIFFIILALIASFFVKTPPEGYGLQINSQTVTFTTKQFTPNEMLRTHNFYILVAALMCGACAFVIANPMLILVGQQRGIDLSILLTGVMAASLANAIGRLLAASLSDLIGRKITVLILFVISLASCVGLLFASGITLIVLFALISFSYGGFFATFPAITTDSFGLKHSGANYGFVMLGLGLASVVAMIVGAVIQSMGLDINARFSVAAIMAALGVILVFFIKQPKQTEPSAQ